MTRPHILAFVTAALLSAGAVAAPAAHAQGAHEHGVSHLDVILDGTVLAIDLRGAGHHLAGFEHAPEGAQQQAAWQAAVDGLTDAASLFELPPQANCALQSAEAIPPITATDDGEAGSAPQESRHHDEPDDGHGHDHRPEHAHHHAGHDDLQANADGTPDHAHGADWQARYRFECANPDRLTAIEVGLFTVFPAHEEVRYQRFSDGAQGGGTLTPGRTRLELR